MEACTVPSSGVRRYCPDAPLVSKRICPKVRLQQKEEAFLSTQTALETGSLKVMSPFCQ